MASSGQLSFASEMANKGYVETPTDKAPVNCSAPGMLYWEKDNMRALCDDNGCYIVWKDPDERKAVIEMLDSRGYGWMGKRIKQG